MLAVAVPNSGAVHDFDPPSGIGDLFELDNDAIDATPTPAGDDWDTVVVDETGDDVRHTFATDFFNEDDDTFCQGTKEIDDVSAWKWCDNTASNDKNDIEHAYAAIYTVPSTGPFAGTPLAGHQILYMGADRFANNGDSGLGFMFLQTGLEKQGCSPTPCTTLGGTFGNGLGGPAVHVDGDIYVVTQFTQGGEAVTADVYRWDGIAPGIGWVLQDTGVDCDDADPNDVVCGTVFGDGDNGTNLATDAPWMYTAKFPGEDPPGTPRPNDFAEGTFFEGGVDLTDFGLEGCFQTILADTSQSQNINESAQDFVFGEFELCSVEIRKSGPALSKVGDEVTYDFEIENTGAAKLFLDTIVDDVLGDLESAAPDACDVLDVGEICSFSVNYTVQPGDPDPLVNTVEVVYKGEQDLSGAAISATDDHSVNLFQPGVDVVKTGDELSKVGDAVNYTITVTNTSSDDSPNLVNGTINDTLLGDLLDPANPFVTASTCTATLPTTASCTINATRTVLAGDADPLPNTVTVHYNPNGFSNDITDSDDHSVELFQPKVEVVKGGTELSKVGDTVTYSFTIFNRSSADSPNLEVASISDTLLGDLLDEAPAACDVLTDPDGDDSGGTDQCSFTVNRVVQAGDPDPLENTVTVVYHPTGFPNDVSDSDDHSVNLFQPKVEVVKGGTELSKVGDTVTYSFTIFNRSSADSPNLEVASISDTLLGDLLDEAPAACDVLTAPDGDDVGGTDQCSFTVDRNVQAGDPDPLENTVTVVYHPAGFPNDISDTDSHSVNLFQPSVDVVKTGDAFSKVGDTVNYTIAVTNTSSADSPNLVNGTIVDSLLGDLLDPANPFVITSNCAATLPTTESCTIEATRTVLAGDPDPLPNTVTVHYNPDGFPNDITDSDNHSVNLVQPGVEVVKTGDELSKVGDAVNYTITVTNTSSDDSPNLVNGTINDTLLGNLLDPANPFVTASDCAATLPTTAGVDSCTITATRTVQPGDPDPLPNTVTVHYNPGGLPNDVSASDDHSVNLFQPKVEVVKGGTELSKVGDTVTYSFAIFNRSSADSPHLQVASISDTLLGDLLGQAPAACDELTAPDGDDVGGTDQCSFTVDRNVQAGDPDPLENTVTVVYHPVGFPNDISDTDGHSVNLFQPAVEVAKTGDTLSKVGDPVNYTITVTNTSSDDSPNLVNGTVNDTLLGNLLDPANPFVTASDCAATLPTTAGVDSCTITATRTVQASDPDPLPNTVTVHYNPNGFPNDITDSDDHSVNLFTASVSVTKVCAPASVTVGQTVTFTCSIMNTSSNDAPNLILDSVTDVRNPGNVVTDLTATATANGCGSLAPAASCSFTYTATATTVGTLTNTVTAHYHPNGFPNDVTDDGTCSVQVTGGEGCTPGFFKRFTNVWDQLSDPIVQSVRTTINNLGPPFVYNDANGGLTTQLFRDIFGLTSAQMSAAGLNPNLTMLQAIDLGGGGFQKLARHGVAGLLSSASVAYPFTTVQVLQMVQTAIANLQAEPTATQLADANNLSHQNCPKS